MYVISLVNRDDRRDLTTTSKGRSPRGPSGHKMPGVAARLKIYNRRCISSKEQPMQVARWGNSLAIRLPAAVVEALDLKEGDQIEIRIAAGREFEVKRDTRGQKALARLRRLRRPLPAGFTFSRDEANGR
jgi:antitoxin MazE